MDQINVKLKALSKNDFRAQFHLGDIEKKMVEEKGLDTIMEHAGNLVSKRLAPERPFRDGRQTPFKGHPVFIAQHSTATCCRSCLLKWHQIEKGKQLSGKEIDYVVEVIMSWIKKEL